MSWKDGIPAELLSATETALQEIKDPDDKRTLEAVLDWLHDGAPEGELKIPWDLEKEAAFNAERAGIIQFGLQGLVNLKRKGLT